MPFVCIAKQCCAPHVADAVNHTMEDDDNIEIFDVDDPNILTHLAEAEAKEWQRITDLN